MEAIGFEARLRAMDLERTLSNQLNSRISICAAALIFALAAAFTGFVPDCAHAHKDHNKPKAKEAPAALVKAAPAPPPAELPADTQDRESHHSATEPDGAAEPRSVSEHDSSSKHEPISTSDSISERTAAEGDHEDHATNVPQPLAWLGKFHPPVTHFPIALLVAAALAEFLLMRRPGAFFEHATRYCVWLGAGSALLAAVLGWLFAGFQLVDDEWVMTTHRWFGTGTALWAAFVYVLCERAYAGAASRQPFRLALFTGAGLVSVTGFFGGALLYGLDHFTGW